MKLELTPEEVMAIFRLLGEAPTKLGLFPLMLKIKAQAEAQKEIKE